MEWVDALKGKTIGLDTAPLIYYIEEHPDYIDIVAPFFEALKHHELRVVTSTVTFMEVLVAPMKRNNAELATKYRAVFSQVRDLTMIAFSQSIAEEAARLRAVYKLYPADAIQMGTALHSRATVFLTNDKRLASVSGMDILILDDLKAKPNSDDLKTDS